MVNRDYRQNESAHINMDFADNRYHRLMGMVTLRNIPSDGIGEHEAVVSVIITDDVMDSTLPKGPRQSIH